MTGPIFGPFDLEFGSFWLHFLGLNLAFWQKVDLATLGTTQFNCVTGAHHTIHSD